MRKTGKVVGKFMDLNEFKLFISFKRETDLAGQEDDFIPRPQDFCEHPFLISIIF